MNSLIEELEQDIHYIDGMNSCMNCGVCTAICPAAEFYNYDPRRIIELIQRKEEVELQRLLKEDTIWYCGECMSCKTRCPRGNTPGGVIMALRKLAQKHGYFVQSEKGRQQYALQRVIGHQILEVGYCVTPDTVIPEMHPEQGPVWEWIYRNRTSFLDRVHSNYNREGAGANRQIDRQSLAELNAIFDVTGGKQFMKQIENYSDQYAQHEEMDMERYFLQVYTINSNHHSEE